MKGSKLYDCKKNCSELSKCCHNTKNRCIEKMCDVDKKECKEMASLLQCMMIMECLCNYICTCCCELECISDTCFKELCEKCTMLSECCNSVKKCSSKACCDYLNCDKIIQCCNKCKQKSKSKSKKK